MYYIPGTGLSGSIGGYTPPVTYYQYSLGGQGYALTSNAAACSTVYYYPVPVYSSISSPPSVTRFFADANLTTGYNGNGYFYKFYKPGAGAQYFSCYIDTDGYVSDMYAC